MTTMVEPTLMLVVATLELEGRRATITFEGAFLEDKEPGLREPYSRRLS